MGKAFFAFVRSTVEVKKNFVCCVPKPELAVIVTEVGLLTYPCNTAYSVEKGTCNSITPSISVS